MFCFFNSLNHLLSGTTSDVSPVAPERTNPSIDVLVLPHGRKSLLVGGEVQPPIKNSRCVGGLGLRRPDKSLVDEVRSGDESGTTWGNAVDFVRHFALLSVDVENCVLLAGHHVNTTAAVVNVSQEQRWFVAWE